MFQANSLPPHLHELAILRVGYCYQAPYEDPSTRDHRRLGRPVRRTTAAAATGDSDELPDDEAAIITWSDRLLDSHTLTGSEREDALWLTLQTLETALPSRKMPSRNCVAGTSLTR
jgi:4-carboxymuconolactone decarboxylase